jgi:hypothetical protein
MDMYLANRIAAITGAAIRISPQLKLHNSLDRKQI